MFINVKRDWECQNSTIIKGEIDNIKYKIPDACNILNHPRLQFGWTDVTRFGSSPSEPANIFKKLTIAYTHTALIWFCDRKVKI